MDKKECGWCGEVKGSNEFYSQNKKYADGTLYVYYNPECKECTSKKAMKWQKENPDKRKEHLNKINATKHKKEMLRKSNKKRLESGKMKEWQRNNPEKLKKYRKYKDMNKKHKISKKEWDSCKQYFNNECAYCGLHISEHFNKFAGRLKHTDFHKEHVNHKGANDLSNCVPSCKECNVNKWANNITDWYTEDNPRFSQKRLNKINKWLNEDYKLYLNEIQ